MSVERVLENAMQRLKRGDTDALRDLYEATAKGVFAVALSIMRDRALAEDVMQETYLQVRRKINFYTQGTHAKAWILTLCRNIALNILKRRKREMPTDFTEEGETNDKKALTYDPQDPLSHTAVGAALRCLAQEERTVVLLFALRSYKHREIALMMNKPLGTVLSIYHRALKKLKNHLKEAN